MDERQGPLLAVVTDDGGDVLALEREALERAAEFETELALTLPPDSEIRGLFLRNAAAYALAIGRESRRGLRHVN